MGNGMFHPKSFLQQPTIFYCRGHWNTNEKMVENQKETINVIIINVYKMFMEKEKFICRGLRHVSLIRDLVP